MAVTHETTVRSGIADYVVDLLDAGTTVTYPFIEFKTSAGTSAVTNGEVAHCDFTGATAFGAASSGVATAGTIADDTSAAGGTTTKAYFYDQDNTPLFSCSVGTSGEDINLSNNVISAGQTVSVTSLTYTAPA